MPKTKPTHEPATDATGRSLPNSAANTAITGILRQARIIPESGNADDTWRDFTCAGLDRLDFASIHRDGLRRMLREAFDAGYGYRESAQ